VLAAVSSPGVLNTTASKANSILASTSICSSKRDRRPPRRHLRRLWHCREGLPQNMEFLSERTGKSLPPQSTCFLDTLGNMKEFEGGFHPGAAITSLTTAAIASLSLLDLS
jgi:hypothetical protein